MGIRNRLLRLHSLKFSRASKFPSTDGLLHRQLISRRTRFLPTVLSGHPCRHPSLPWRQISDSASTRDLAHQQFTERSTLRPFRSNWDGPFGFRPFFYFSDKKISPGSAADEIERSALDQARL